MHRFLDPIFYGDYPSEMRQILGTNLPTFTLEEKNILKSKLDFIGINHYTTFYVEDCIHSTCPVDTYVGNALALSTGERNGEFIGTQV
jgi:beta-glucosidase